jgi:hypothetical protein
MKNSTWELVDPNLNIFSVILLDIVPSQPFPAQNYSTRCLSWDSHGFWDTLQFPDEFFEWSWGQLISDFSIHISANFYKARGMSRRFSTPKSSWSDVEKSWYVRKSLFNYGCWLSKRNCPVSLPDRQFPTVALLAGDLNHASELILLTTVAS